MRMGEEECMVEVKMIEPRAMVRDAEEILLLPVAYELELWSGMSLRLEARM